MLYNASKMEQPPNIIYESKVLFSSGIYGVVVVFSYEFELRNRITRLKMENLRRCCRLENALTGCPIKICCAETKRNFSSVVPRKTYYARLPNRNLYYIKMGKCEAQKLKIQGNEPKSSIKTWGWSFCFAKYGKGMWNANADRVELSLQTFR